MTLSKKQLFSLSVVTMKGVRIGRVVDVGLDSVSQSVVTYYVRPPWQWRMASPLIIKKQQVVNMTQTELIVEDVNIVIPTHEKLLKDITGSTVRQGAAARAPVV